MMIVKKLVIALVLLLVATACGGSDNNESSPDGDTAVAATDGASADAGSTDSESSGSSNAEGSSTGTSADDGDSDGVEIVSGGSFCDLAKQLDENDPLDVIDLDDGEQFYAVALAQFTALVDAAPEPAKSDFALFRDQLQEQADVAAQYDYDFMNPEVQASMITMDTAAMDAAADRIESFVESECGITLDSGSGDDFGADDSTVDIDPELIEGIDAGDQASVIAAIFGVELEVAQCLVDELGLTDDRVLGDLTMEELNREICGTTGLNILTG